MLVLYLPNNKPSVFYLACCSCCPECHPDAGPPDISLEKQRNSYGHIFIAIFSIPRHQQLLRQWTRVLFKNLDTVSPRRTRNRNSSNSITSTTITNSIDTNRVHQQHQVVVVAAAAAAVAVGCNSATTTFSSIKTGRRFP